jgi:hypothetical protein
MISGRPPSPDTQYADVINQEMKGRVVEMRRLFHENAEAFVRRYLIPTNATPSERGSSH